MRHVASKRNRRLLAAALLAAACALASSAPAVRAAGDSDSAAREAEMALERGAESLRRGSFARAIADFSRAADACARSGSPGMEARALLRLAEAQQASGQYRDAARSLERARDLAEAAGENSQLAAIAGALGDVHLAIGPPAVARRQLERALELARAADAPEVAAGVLNNLGNAHAFGGENAAAVDAYAESAELAQSAGRPALAARALANAARAALASGDAARAGELADAAYERARALPASQEKAGLLISIGRTTGRLSERPDRRLRSREQLALALEVATGLPNPRAASYALGYLGALYEEAGRLDDALQLSRRAIFQSQQANAPESLYLWHWQAGRVLAARGATDEAIAEYRRAIDVLQSIRHEMNVGYGSGRTSFRESVGPVYFQLVDLLLRTAAETGDSKRAQALLRSARDTTEQLKAAELTDYLRDDCIDALQAKLRQLEEVSTGALIVYPIVLPDRLELLLSWPGGRMARYSAPVTSEELAQEVGAFRALIENRITREYLPGAQRLYGLLIEPFAADLAKQDVDTLVFVPDGPLRTIPMSALHDGERFLIEKYAIAVTPGVELTDPRPIDRGKLKLLLAGISEPVQGYPELYHVPTELANVSNVLGGEVLLDEEFSVEGMGNELGDEAYNVVHIATHGEIRENVRDSFLLAHDGPLTMDRLETYVGLFRFRDTPLELLTLSACDTAAGNDRAALGLSGIAIKAGARSALGTLWRVNDLATAILVTEFYEQLRDESVSRAVALQRAQIKLRSDFRYRHPGYWSAFLLISNWL